MGALEKGEVQDEEIGCSGCDGECFARHEYGVIRDVRECVCFRGRELRQYGELRLHQEPAYTNVTITWFQPYECKGTVPDFSKYPSGGTISDPDVQITSAKLTIMAWGVNPASVLSQPAAERCGLRRRQQQRALGRR